MVENELKFQLISVIRTPLRFDKGKQLVPEILPKFSIRKKKVN